MLFIFVLLLSHNPPVNGAELSRKFFLMGSELDMTLKGENEVELTKVSEEIIKVVSDYEKKISTWKKDSELSKFNASPIKTLITFSPEVKDTLNKASLCSHLTEGKFHYGLGKLIEAWGLRQTGSIPTEKDIFRFIKGSDLKHFQPKNNKVMKTHADFYLEEGGIAKGAALDLAIAVSRKNNLKDLDLNFSGQVFVLKEKSIAITHPEKREQKVLEVKVENSSLSTSANTNQKFKVGALSFGHILNPKTGKPLELFNRSLSVIHPEGTYADCLSTGLFVLSENQNKLKSWMKKHANAEVIQIDTKEETIKVLASCSLKGRITNHLKADIEYVCKN
ncbi:MAG: FAD:protein FMN transferase [Bacteriovoracaceae bacterium]